MHLQLSFVSLRQYQMSQMFIVSSNHSANSMVNKLPASLYGLSYYGFLLGSLISDVSSWVDLFPLLLMMQPSFHHLLSQISDV